jgi:hypothetical protein
MENLEFFKVKITNTNGEELNLTIYQDSDIYEWAKHFKTILNWLEFHPDCIKEVLPDNEE